MMIDGNRRLLETEVVKAANTSATLRRFGTYFRTYWPGLLVAMALIVVGVWTQVRIPEVSGQAVDYKI